MTTITEPRRTADPADDPAAVEVVETVKAATPAPAGASEADPPALRDMPRMLWPVAAVAVVGGTVAAVTGFALSYRALADAAERWGFGHWGSRAFPLGVDGAILALYAFDLILVWRQMPKPLLRIAAHAMTGVTIALNVIAAAAAVRLSSWDAFQADPGRLLSHAAMPAVFVLAVEGLRHLITRTARLEAGAGTLTLRDWLLAPGQTWRVWRQAGLWGYTYDAVRTLERERAVYRVWLRHREEIERGMAEDAVSVLDRLPDLLAPYGVTVKEALALPDRMRREEQRRRAERERAEQELRHQAEQEQREREHAETLARLAAEAEQIRVQGEVAALRATVDGERRAAEHRAAALADTAGIEASAARSAAERAATEAQRRAEAEEQAEDSARTAALRRKAAEDAKAAARAEAEAARLKEQTEEARLAAARAEAETQELAARAAEDAARAAQAQQDAAQAREAAAALDLRAALAEEAAGLPDRERQVRRVARMILAEAGGVALRMPTTHIERRLGVANSTASGYRDAAAQLIASGYDPATDPIHAMEVQR